MKIRLYVLYALTHFSNPCCLGVRFGSVYHSFNATKKEIHYGHIPTAQRFTNFFISFEFILKHVSELFLFFGEKNSIKILLIFTEENIGNSRDCSFEHMIKLRTKGEGVDFVLNSLAEDQLHASIRCLGRAGTFLEIGKFDLANDSKIGT